MAGIAFPSWAYNATQGISQIVASQAAFNALTGPGVWSFNPFPPASQIAPGDPGFSITDDRLQQMLVEARMLNMMFAHANAIVEDPQSTLRPDILANDSAITT